MRYQHRSFTTPKSLFRRISPNLLADYFTSHKILTDFDWTSYQRNFPDLLDGLLSAYQAIPIMKREEIDEELRDVNDLCGLSAQETLQAVAQQFRFVWDDSMMPEDRALRVLLKNKDAFRTAYSWSHLESYESFNDYCGSTPKKAQDWSKIEQGLTNAWRLLLQSQNKGYGRVYIEHYQTNDRIAYLVYYEAPKQYITRFDDRTNKPVEKPDKPVLESLMIYYPALGKLKIKAERASIAKEARDNYARLVLGDDNFLKASGKERIYDLNQFKKKLESNNFPTDPKDEITSVQVVCLRFKPDALTRDIIEINSVGNLKERIRLLKLDLTPAVIKRVKLQIKFAGKGASRIKSFSLSMPNKNTLSDSKKDRLIEQYLVKWGIANR